MRHEHVRIRVEDTRGVEHVPACRLAGAQWRILRSPLYAMQVAAGDVIRVVNPTTGEFELVSRGGNVCVQLYLAEREDDDETTKRVLSTTAPAIRLLGGSLDAHTAGLLSFTIPSEVDFPAIEKEFAAVAKRYPGAQWQYANVYDPRTGAPLGWWQPRSRSRLSPIAKALVWFLGAALVVLLGWSTF